MASRYLSWFGTTFNSNRDMVKYTSYETAITFWIGTRFHLIMYQTAINI